ncbi:MAG TPA: hypothetical protein VGD88_04420 [Opitutaceae bacterium]
MKLFVFILSLLVTAGCSTPLAEINYRGSLATAQSDPFEVTEEFARALEKETDLKIVDRSKRTGTPRTDGSASIHLRTPRTASVWVIIISYAAEREIHARIAGDIDSPIAKELAAACERVHSQLYPGTDFVRFQRNRGMLGP